MILPHITLENACSLLERLRKAVESTTIELDGDTKVGITVSVGIAPLREGVTPGALVNMADELLYESKRAGRNRVSCTQNPI